MLHALVPSQFAVVRPLFQRPHLLLIIDAVIAGNSPASIWVDNPTRPDVALLWDQGHCLHLAGATDDRTTVEALADLAGDEIMPAMQARDISIFKIYDTGLGWAVQLDDIFPDLSRTRMARCFFTFDRPRIPDWRECIPAGFRLQPIDQTLLANTGLGNHQDLVYEILSGWPSLDHFLAAGFGFCLVHEEEIVCRCTAEYVSPDKCGIGIETVEPYQGRGLASLTASAFVEDSLRRGSMPHWDAWTANLPSVTVALKVGFRKTADYQAYLARLGEVASD